MYVYVIHPRDIVDDVSWFHILSDSLFDIGKVNVAVK